jgi:hypothetical protein
MLTYQYTYAYGAVSPLDGKFDSLVLPLVNTECIQLFITEIGKRYPAENIVMVVDGAGRHKCNAFGAGVGIWAYIFVTALAQESRGCKPEMSAAMKTKFPMRRLGQPDQFAEMTVWTMF